MRALPCDLERNIVGGIALELEVGLGQMVEVLVEQLRNNLATRKSKLRIGLTLRRSKTLQYQ